MHKTYVVLMSQMLRHCTFVTKLDSIGMLNPERWANSPETFDTILSRYQVYVFFLLLDMASITKVSQHFFSRFLNLASEVPEKLNVPTVGLDIACVH